MSTHREDTLPQSPAVSQLVRRIYFRLDGTLVFNGHRCLSTEERAALFDLGEASKVLDRIAILPRMADAEQRARRDLLELYDVFDPPIAGHTEPQEHCALCQASVEVVAVSPPCQDFARAPTYGQRIQSLEDAADASGCLP